MSLFKRGSLHKSFLERNQKFIGLLAALLVIAGTTFALLLSGGIFKDTYVVTADFADAAGLKSGDDVLVGGLEAGSIGSIEIEDGVVRVELKVDQSVKMPKDARAEIVVQTLLGRKGVSLTGGSDDSMLADGDHIKIENTRTPVELLDLANRSDPLLRRSDPVALQTFLDEITEVTQGKRRQISTLITGLADVTGAIDSRKKELARLLDSLDTLSGTFAERDDTLVSLIDNLNVVLSNLAERTDDIETLLTATDSASHEIADLVSRNRGQLDSTLNNLHTTLMTLDRHQVDLAATVSYLHDGVLGYSSVGYSQGIPNRWANIFVQSLGPVGIDAFFGPCGGFDQALDQLLGPDPRPCDERVEYGKGGGPGGGGGGEQPPLPIPTPGGDSGGGEGGQTEPGLPGDIGDLIGGATGDATLVDDLREELP